MVAAADHDQLPPALRRPIMPEWSHLNRRYATVFIDAYVRRLVAQTPRLTLHLNTPPPLDLNECGSSSERSL